MEDVDVVVIGSGAGGLTAATALARAGHKVVVFEQHELPGGWCHSFTLEGYHFSPGVHYLGSLHEGGMLRRMYEGLDLDLDFYELNPDGFDQVHLGPDFRFDIPAGLDTFRERLKQRFPTEASGIDGYLDTTHSIAQALVALERVRGKRDIAMLPWKLRHILRYGLMPLDRYLDRFTRDPQLRAVLSMQAGDHGIGPSRAPVGMHAAIQNHYFNGAWYPKGGGRALPKAYIKSLRKHGGMVKVRTPVERILTEGRGRSRKAIGVRLGDGTEVRAKHVISNADPYMTYKRLLPDHGSRWIDWRLGRMEWSISAISLFFAADIDAEALELDSGNVWYADSPDIQAGYDVAHDGNWLDNPTMPGFFLTCTSMKDPSKYKGVHTLEAFCFVSHDAFRKWAHTRFGDRPEDYAAMKADLTERMLDTLEAKRLPGLRDKLKFVELGTPLTNEHYVAAHRGNLYGIAKTRGQVGPLAFPIKTHINGLWQCGASTLSHGVAGAAASGLMLAQQLSHTGGDTLLSGKGRVRLLDPRAERGSAAAK